MVNEIVLYRFRPDAAAEAIDATMQATDDFLHAMPGFMRRQTLFDAGSSTWIDLVEWRSMEDATAAAAQFAACPAAATFAEIGDPSFMHMFHATTVLTGTRATGK